MKYKTFFIAAFIILGFLTPNLLPIQAATPSQNNLTNQERLVLIRDLIEQVKILQAQLEVMLEDEVAINQSLSAAITDSDYTRGDENAQIQILTFMDFECPFCKMFHSTLETILAENPNVSVTYRHFPVAQLHPDAMKLAVAAECAGQIGKDKAFWKVTDAIFNLPSTDQGISKKSLVSILSKAGISNSTYNKCVKGKVAEKAVEDDLVDAEVRGIYGTPQSFVYKNGKEVSTIAGSQPVDTVQTLISDLLKE